MRCICRMRSGLLVALLLHLSAATKPSVLVMIADDLRPSFGSFGQSFAVTPHVDALAASGMLFQRAYCQVSVCAPSRNSIFSGRRPDTSGVWNFIDWFRNETNGAEAWLSLPEYFKSHGYISLGLGKTFHGCTNEGGLLAKGYCDLQKSWSDVQPYYPYVREHCPRGSFCHLEDENEIFDHNLTAHAVAALRTYGTKPLFLAVGFKKPHAPWGTPSRFFDMYSPNLPVAAHPTAPTDMPDVAFIHNFGATLENGTSYDWGPQKPVPAEAAALLRQGYYAAVSYVDEQVGKILAELEALKMSESTIVAFTSDHGYNLGEHGEWEKKANFELTNRVPLIIRAPGIPQSAGKRTTVFYDHVDLYPTLVELAGLPSPQAAIGIGESKSLAQVFHTPGLQEHELDGAAAAYSQYPRCAKTGIDKHSCNNAPKNTFDYMGYSVRTSAWRYTTWLDWDGQELQAKWSAGPSFHAEELYSHTNDTGTDHDAYENENVAADATHKAVKEQLWEMLRARFPSIAKTAQ